jgi:hypothetical protein
MWVACDETCPIHHDPSPAVALSVEPEHAVEVILQFKLGSFTLRVPVLESEMRAGRHLEVALLHARHNRYAGAYHVVSETIVGHLVVSVPVQHQ